MNNKIAKILKGYVETVTWADKVAGLVQTANVTIKKGDSRTDASYPISCDVTYDACIKGRYDELAPNSRKKSVMYFEDRGGVQYDRKEGDRVYYTAQLRLVVWINLKLINDAECQKDSGDCGVSGDYVLDILSVLPKMPFDVDGFFSISVAPPSQVERSVDIFGRYTYNEPATQYLMYPFDYFALDIDVEFMIPC